MATNLKNWKAAEDALNDLLRDIKGRTSNAGKMKKYKIELTKLEISHILKLVETNEREGWCYGPEGQYQNRSDRIKAKLVAGYSHLNLTEETINTDDANNNH